MLKIVVYIIGLSSAFLLTSALDAAPTGPAHPDRPSAILIDQASATDPNPALVETARTLLGAAGFALDYAPAEEVTLDLFHTLPRRDYDLIIIRAHSAMSQWTDSTLIFTSDVATQRNMAAVGAGFPGTELVQYHDGEQGAREAVYYGVGAAFVNRSMEGDFGGATVLMMGCKGLDTPWLGQAFLARGAGHYVAWEGWVLPDRTDAAIVALLDTHAQGRPWQQAVAATARDLGEDPVHGSELRLLPA